jgi:hypothetical protein
MAARLHRVAADVDRINAADCQVHADYDEVFAGSK